MKKVKVSELSGKELDWAMHHALNLPIQESVYNQCYQSIRHFHDNWENTGKIIEHYNIHLESNLGNVRQKEWTAMIPLLKHASWLRHSGKTPIEASCRVFIAYKLGEFVEIPE